MGAANGHTSSVKDTYPVHGELVEPRPFDKLRAAGRARADLYAAVRVSSGRLPDNEERATAYATVGDLPARRRGIIRAWCMYDWANSAFATSGIAAIVPIYFVFLFKDALGESASFLGITLTGSSTWSLGVAVSTAVVALSSPVLGIIADRAALKKTLLGVYAAAGSLFIALAFFSAYTSHPWAWLLGMFILANVGFAGSLVFYNSFLSHIAPPNLLDDVSSRGFGYGYVGGGLLLLVHLVLILLTEDTAYADLVTRASIASIGVWWFGWALWTLKVLPEPPVYNPVDRLTPWKALTLAARELRRTFREVGRFKVVLVYLGAYLLFNDGVQTVISIAGAFAADSIGIPLTFNMVTILIVQFVAAGGAMAFAWLARRTTTKIALTAALAGWVLIVLAGVAVASLVPDRHGEFDYQLSYRADAAAYAADAVPELGDSQSDSMWREEGHEIDEGELIPPGRAAGLLEAVRLSERAAYSISIEGGALDGEKAVGRQHPSTLGDGPMDWWPEAVRSAVWEPLGLDAGYQWMLLGICLGLVLGGSQALARSLFAQITPETRSGEFFSFFGFMSRASAVFGPTLYVFVTAAFDARVAVTSIIVIIIAGMVVLRWVDVAAGARVAAAEDAGRRRP